MERRQLEYFLAVVDAGSVTGAAATLHVSQPTISVALRALEKESGGQLFERSPIGLTVTAAGLALVEPARQVLRDLAVARERVRDVLGLAGGSLDIGAVPAVASGWLLGPLSAFRRAYPEVTVRVDTEIEDEIITSRVRSGHYNLGLTVSPPDSPGLSSTKVGDQVLQALLPPRSPAAGQPISIEELGGMDLVTLHRDQSRSRRWLEAQLGARDLIPRIGVELGSTDSIVPLVADGIGYALWWTPMPATSLGECVLRPLVPELQRPIFIANRSGVVSPAADAFLKIVLRS